MKKLIMIIALFFISAGFIFQVLRALKVIEINNKGAVKMV